MNRTKKFFYNAASSMIMQVVVLISGLIVPRLMLVTYGSEINGLVSSISQFISYFSLVEAGLAGASIFAMYKPLANNDFDDLSSVVTATVKFYNKAGYIFLVLVLGLSFLYPVFIKTSELNNVEVGCLVLVLSISTALNFFAMARYRSLITADQRGYVLNFLTIISTIVNTVIVVALTTIGVNIIILRAVSIVSVLIAPCFLFYYVKKKYPKVNYKAKPNKMSLNKRWDAFFLQVLGSVQVACPIVLATMFTTLKQVSVYSIFNMVITGIVQVISIFTSGVCASFGELLAKKEYDTFEKVYSEFECLSYFMTTLFLSTTMVLIMPFVNLYTNGITDTNYNQPIIGFLFVINAFLFSIKNPQGTLVSSAGLFKETRWRTLAQALIAIVVGAILAPKFGIAGILIGLILSNIYRDIDLVIFIPKVLGHISLSKTVKRVILMCAEFALISIPFMFFKIRVNNYLEWILLGVIVFLLALLIMCVLTYIFDKEVFKRLINRGLNFVKKEKKNG